MAASVVSHAAHTHAKDTIDSHPFFELVELVDRHVFGHMQDPAHLRTVMSCVSNVDQRRLVPHTDLGVDALQSQQIHIVGNVFPLVHVYCSLGRRGGHRSTHIRGY